MPARPPGDADVMAARLRRLEARVAMLEDCVDVHGPPPKRRPIPELSDEAKGLLGLAILLGFLLIVGKARSNRE